MCVDAAGTRLIAAKTKMVFPLYNEEVHILARREVTSFDDLAGRCVAIGREGSGNYLTARLLFNVSEIAALEMVLIDTDAALAELKAGRIDLQRKPHRGRPDGPGAVVNKSITEFYPRAQIPASIHPWQGQAVETVAVKSVLVSFDFQRHCDVVGKFAKMVSDNMAWLARHGHPKWKSVDLDYP